jgi:hypothetical protein
MTLFGSQVQPPEVLSLPGQLPQPPPGQTPGQGFLLGQIPQPPLTFDEARIGNATLGKEIFTDPARLHQHSLDIRKYEADQNVGIETQEDLNILHDMCSVAAAYQPSMFITITPPECNNNPFSGQVQESQNPTPLQPQFQQQPQQNPGGLVQLANKCCY